MAPPSAQRVLVEQGGSIAAPTLLGQGPARIPTGGKIRAGIKVLTRKAAEQPKAREPGPYWVSPKRWNNWVVAHASIQPGTWFLPGEEAPVGDEDMLEIDERRIVRDAGS